MHCIIIEDQPPAQRILQKYIGDLGLLHLKATFSDAIQAVERLKTDTIELFSRIFTCPKCRASTFCATSGHYFNDGLFGLCVGELRIGHG